MNRLVIIGESDAGIGAALRARKIVAVHAVRISNSLPGSSQTRAKFLIFAELLACVKANVLLAHATFW